MLKLRKQINKMTERNYIRVVRKGEDNSNVLYFISLSKLERLNHLEQLRTQYFRLTKEDDSKQGFQRVYRTIKLKRS